jgi:hypothetical protein
MGYKVQRFNYRRRMSLTKTKQTKRKFRSPCKRGIELKRVRRSRLDLTEHSLFYSTLAKLYQGGSDYYRKR